MEALVRHTFRSNWILYKLIYENKNHFYIFVRRLIFGESELEKIDFWFNRNKLVKPSFCKIKYIHANPALINARIDMTRVKISMLKNQLKDLLNRILELFWFQAKKGLLLSDFPMNFDLKISNENFSSFTENQFIAKIAVIDRDLVWYCYISPLHHDSCLKGWCASVSYHSYFHKI